MLTGYNRQKGGREGGWGRAGVLSKGGSEGWTFLRERVGWWRRRWLIIGEERAQRAQRPHRDSTTTNPSTCHPPCTPARPISQGNVLHTKPNPLLAPLRRTSLEKAGGTEEQNHAGPRKSLAGATRPHRWRHASIWRTLLHLPAPSLPPIVGRGLTVTERDIKLQRTRSTIPRGAAATPGLRCWDQGRTREKGIHHANPRSAAPPFGIDEAADSPSSASPSLTTTTTTTTAARDAGDGVVGVACSLS